MALKINEIFFSIQGESSFMGWPTVFVRTSGCHLRCGYCDTTYAYHEGEMKELAEILKVIESHPTKRVCITGGEPLLQKEIYSLMSELCDRSYQVSLETSGDIDCHKVDSRVHKVVDVKTPDSEEGGRFAEANLRLDPVNTEFKFVICSEKDFEWSQKYCEDHGLFGKYCILFSPSYGVVSENWLAKKILSEGSSARLQLQLHKYIWSPHQRGI